MAKVKNIVELTVAPLDPAIELAAHDAIEVANKLAVVDARDSLFAQGFRKGLSEKIDELNNQRLAITRPMDAAKALVMNLFRAPVERLTQARAIADSKIVAFDEAQRAIAREQQRLADELAAKERAKLEARAAKAAAKGQAAQADELLDTAAAVVAPVIQAETVRALGTGFREVWSYDVIDEAKINRPYLEPSESKIGSTVRSLHEKAADVVGGIRVSMRRVLTSSRS